MRAGVTDGVRIGDHAVDIGEQVAYLLTAEFREFTDASHPTPREA